MDPEPATEVMYAIPSTGTPRGNPEVVRRKCSCSMLRSRKGRWSSGARRRRGHRPTAPPKRGRTRGTKAGTRAPATAPALPFDAGVARLAEALTEAGAGVEAVDEEAGTWVAWLPTVGGRPVTSSPLIDEPPANATEAGIAPWAVSGLRLRADRAADLLGACAGRQTLAPGIVVGKTLEYASAAFRFAAALAARQQFLPGVAPGRVVSRPLGAGRRRGRRAPPAQLARAMPSACRALGRDAGTPPETHPTAAASAFVAAMVDHLVRSSTEPAAPSPARPPARRKVARFDSIHDQWLAALRSPEGLMEGDPAELEQFAEQVRRWRLPIAVTAAAPFRLCFRLEEPEVEDDDRDGGKWVVREPGEWTVRYLLQAADDPSLLVPAADAWDPRGARRRSSGGATSSRASTCWRPWGRRRRSAPGSRRA